MRSRVTSHSPEGNVEKLFRIFFAPFYLVCIVLGSAGLVYVTRSSKSRAQLDGREGWAQEGTGASAVHLCRPDTRIPRRRREKTPLRHEKSRQNALKRPVSIDSAWILSS